MIDFSKLRSKRKEPTPLKSTYASPMHVRMSTNLTHYLEYTQMTDQITGYDHSMFLGATLTEANTRRPPIPGGTTLRGTLGKPVTRQTEGKQEKNQGVIYTWVDIPVELDLTQKPEIRTLVGQDKVTLTHSFRLDISATGQGLDMSPGKNNGLRQLRDALDMNKPGEPFQLLTVEGRPVMANIKNEPYQGDVFDKIAAIAHI